MSDKLIFRAIKAAKNIGETFPYYSPAANRLRFRIDNDNVSTMAINCKLVISMNESFAGKLKDKEFESVILHEIMHYVYNHHERYTNNPFRKVLSHSIHNIAMDLEINEFIPDIQEYTYTAKEFDLPPRKSYEEYLSILYKNMPENLKELLYKDASGLPDDVQITEEEYEEFKEVLKENLIDLISEMKKAGTESGSCDVTRKVKKKKYRWEQVFQNVITTKITEITAGFKYRIYQRANRRYSHNPDIIFPQFIDYKRKISITIIMDISGSMGDNVNKMYGIMKSMVDIIDIDIKVTILEVNVSVENIIYDFNLNKEKINSKDGGGTEMGAGLKYTYDEKLESDLIIVMTDSYTSWPNPPIFPEKTVVLTDKPDVYNGHYPVYPVYFD